MCKKRKGSWIALAMLALCLSALFCTLPVNAAKKTGKIYNDKGNVIAEYNKKGEMVLIPSKNANTNYKNLTYLVSGNKKKTVVIPKGSSIKVNGVIKPGDNTTIIATGAKITCKEKSYAILCPPDKQVKNLKIIGGTWRSPHKDGWTGNMFALAFVDGLEIDGVNITHNYMGIAMEIVACENVTVKNCTVKAIGSNPKDCLKPQIQIDIATKATAPKIAAYGKKYAKGQTCENVKILNNTVTGARAVCVNYTNSEGGKYKDRFHKNIVIKGNTLTGTTSEALAYYNVIGGKISDNIITTKATRTTSNSVYTIGLHIAMFGVAPKAMASSTLTISGNTIKGNRNGIHIKAYFNEDTMKCYSRFGTIKITNNKVYCKKGKDNAIVQVKESCDKWILENNTCKKWK